MSLALAVPISDHDLTAAAYTYALVHVPSKRVYLGYTDNIRKARNMWDHRLRNPEGNPGVPVPLRSFAWASDEWVFKLGKGYGSEQEARDAYDTACASKPAGVQVLNRAMGRPRLTTIYTPSGERAVAQPHPIPAAAMAYAWPDFLRYMLALNRLGNPSDGQVRQIWKIFHDIHGNALGTGARVPDPERATRRFKAERNKRYQQTYRAKKNGGA